MLISTWKEGWRKTDKVHQGIMANYLDKKLKKQGLTVFDKTRDMVEKEYLSRGEGILDFIQRHKVDKYVVLDDYQYDYDGCGLTEGHIKKQYVYENPEKLTYSHFLDYLIPFLKILLFKCSNYFYLYIKK